MQPRARAAEPRDERIPIFQYSVGDAAIAELGSSKFRVISVDFQYSVGDAPAVVAPLDSDATVLAFNTPLEMRVLNHFCIPCLLEATFNTPLEML